MNNLAYSGAVDSLSRVSNSRQAKFLEQALEKGLILCAWVFPFFFLSVVPKEVGFCL